MKKYVIPVGSPEISKQVQEALFSAGFSWRHSGSSSGQVVKTRDEWHIIVNSRFEGSLSYGQDTEYHMQKIIDDGWVLISSQEVIASPFQLDGAKKPVKEMTMAELEDALGYPVKIVKK